jgi:4-aminobutyrate aminotransferase
MLAPGELDKVLFCPGEVQAVGIALKLARLATGRHKTISMWDSYHEATLDIISIGEEAIFRQNKEPILPGTEHALPPDEYRCVFGCGDRGGCDLTCARNLEYILEKEGNILTLTPALTITKAEMDKALDIIEECLAEIKSKERTGDECCDCPGSTE